MKTKCLFLPVLALFCLTSPSQVITAPIIKNPRQIFLPYNRIIQPAGLQIYFGDRSLENHSLDASLSPDGKWLAVEERYSIVLISTEDKSIRFVLDNRTNEALKGGMNTYSGIIWYKGIKGLEVYWSTIGKGNRSYVVSATWDGSKALFGRMLEYKKQSPSKLALPNEILIKK
jgi:hypothetical protein